ncbi:MAG: glutathione S-transferase family protein [Betaproteobacteria bacterium]|nr:glutathione S-transferase family protein [Betaproteobacteria bacterium]MDH4324815.1 glutathione S-transferase family protein [Betaproteobacteria bacterium]MDH5210757.1 glutathione S-transferase family protein [Betaproteobacteria bacterium]
MIELYFAPGACSFVPHVGLEAVKAATGQDFKPHLVKLHKNENKTPEYLAMNPNGQVPVLVVDGKPLSQIVAICDYLDRSFPKVGLLPTDSWQRAQALSQLAWMNNTVHPTFTRWFRSSAFAESEVAQAELKRVAPGQFRAHLERIQEWSKAAGPYWFGDQVSFHDAYCFTLLRWGGYAGIDPDSLPVLKAYIERVVQAPPVAAALARERIALDTYKKAA